MRDVVLTRRRDCLGRRAPACHHLLIDPLRISLPRPVLAELDLKNGSLDKPAASELGSAWLPKWQSIHKYDESIDFAACVRADIWRRPGWDGRSAVVVGTPPALGVQGRRKADRGSDWHTDRTRTGSVDRIRKNYVRPENKPGQADDRNGHPFGRSAYAIWTGSNLSPKAPAAEHTTDG